MPEINYYLSEGGSVNTVVALGPDGPATALSTHPHFDDIVKGLKAGDESVFELFDIATGVMRKFSQITDRVSWDGVNVLFDGNVVHSALSDQLARAIEHGLSNYAPLAKFWEKLESNPNEHSRRQAYDWLACHKFQITEEGDMVGFKGVQFYYEEVDGTEVYRSVRNSEALDVPSAFVNGNPIEPLSYVPQAVGDVVSLPREEVAHDPAVSCARGLHVSTYSYAQSWAGNGVTFEVHVNPRDIVSVPTNAGGQKVRVNRYVVARVSVDGDTGDSPVLTKENPTHVWAGDVGYKV